MTNLERYLTHIRDVTDSTENATPPKPTKFGTQIPRYKHVCQYVLEMANLERYRIHIRESES